MRPAKIFSLIVLPPFGQYLITLEETGGSRLIPIWIGAGEGTAIAIHLQGEQAPRPLTHDLFVHVLDKLAVRIERVIVTDIKESTYYAVIEFIVAGKKMAIDARPSDSLALAVRTGAPIFIDERVFEKSPVIQKPISGEEVEAFKRDLQNLRPEDFFKGPDKSKNA